MFLRLCFPLAVAKSEKGIWGRGLRDVCLGTWGRGRVFGDVGRGNAWGREIGDAWGGEIGDANVRSRT